MKKTEPFVHEGSCCFHNSFDKNKGRFLCLSQNDGQSLYTIKLFPEDSLPVDMDFTAETLMFSQITFGTSQGASKWKVGILQREKFLKQISSFSFSKTTKRQSLRSDKVSTEMEAGVQRRFVSGLPGPRCEGGVNRWGRVWEINYSWNRPISLLPSVQPESSKDILVGNWFVALHRNHYYS